MRAKLPREWYARLAFACVAVGTVLFTVTAARAQETVTYYTTDAVGSVRMVTDAGGAVLARYDYLPFGDLCGSACGPAAITDRRQFAGEERDGETGLDYFGARYYATGSGRFTSPDPVTGNELRMVSPQRWNRYAYAINNPMNFGDPDGLDVIVFNFVDGAKGYGHLGIMAVYPQNGSALYAGFNPRHRNAPLDAGDVVLRGMAPGSIRFENGRPTLSSWAALKQQVAIAENRLNSRLIRAQYYSTTLADTISLERYMLATRRSPPLYNVAANNCQSFCIRGLQVAGIDAPAPRSLAQAAPNIYFSAVLLELATRVAIPPVRPNVATSETFCVPEASGCP